MKNNINNENEPVYKKTWDEFRNTGLLWFINSILHLFGWCIVVEVDPETRVVTDSYPARTSFRGFDEKSNSNGYHKVTAYLDENIKEILAETEDEKFIRRY